MSLNPWFKFYGGEYLSDPKIASLSAQERSVWVTLLALASVSSTPGKVEYLTTEILLEKSGVRFNPYDTAEWDKCLGVLSRFERMKMVKLHEDGTIEINNWTKRQETALTNAERQARWRERNEKVTKPVTKITLEKRREEKNKKAISVEIASPSEIREVRVDNEGRDKQPAQKKDNGVLSLRDKLYTMLEKENGVRPTPNMGDYKQLQKAMKHLDEKHIVEMLEDAMAIKQVHTVREVFTDRQVDIKREELV